MTFALPSWTVASPKRREHITRVVDVLATWSKRMHLAIDEASAWRDAGAWHDALRDEADGTLRLITGDMERPAGMLHGPAAAARLASEGEARHDVLDAIRWHTVGSARWHRTGRALYMADFLEPGRGFMQRERAALVARVPDAFDDVFRDVVRMRLKWALRSGKSLSPETVLLWNEIR